jgi:hypothetical protein
MMVWFLTAVAILASCSSRPRSFVGMALGFSSETNRDDGSLA